MTSQTSVANKSGQTHDEETACWICLDIATATEGLVKPCSCPRYVHRSCLARWQLQSAGKEEELRCRFCSKTLPDWKSNLTPPNVKPATPVMAIRFEGKTYKLRVKPGPDGLRDFQAQVRKTFGFDVGTNCDITFECQVPNSGEKMKLTGLSSYIAATHCAAITAAQRIEKRQNTSSATTGSAPSSPGNSQPLLYYPPPHPSALEAHAQRTAVSTHQVVDSSNGNSNVRSSNLDPGSSSGSGSSSSPFQSLTGAQAAPGCHDAARCASISLCSSSLVPSIHKQASHLSSSSSFHGSHHRRGVSVAGDEGTASPDSDRWIRHASLDCESTVRWTCSPDDQLAGDSSFGELRRGLFSQGDLRGRGPAGSLPQRRATVNSFIPSSQSIASSNKSGQPFVTQEEHHRRCASSAAGVALALRSLQLPLAVSSSPQELAPLNSTPSPVPLIAPRGLAHGCFSGAALPPAYANPAGICTPVALVGQAPIHTNLRRYDSPVSRESYLYTSGMLKRPTSDAPSNAPNRTASRCPGRGSSGDVALPAVHGEDRLGRSKASCMPTPDDDAVIENNVNASAVGTVLPRLQRATPPPLRPMPAQPIGISSCRAAGYFVAPPPTPVGSVEPTTRFALGSHACAASPSPDTALPFLDDTPTRVSVGSITAPLAASSCMTSRLTTALKQSATASPTPSCSTPLAGSRGIRETSRGGSGSRLSDGCCSYFQSTQGLPPAAEDDAVAGTSGASPGSRHRLSRFTAVKVQSPETVGGLRRAFGDPSASATSAPASSSWHVLPDETGQSSGMEPVLPAAHRCEVTAHSGFYVNGLGNSTPAPTVGGAREPLSPVRSDANVADRGKKRSSVLPKLPPLTAKSSMAPKHFCSTLVSFVKSLGSKGEGGSTPPPEPVSFLTGSAGNHGSPLYPFAGLAFSH